MKKFRVVVQRPVIQEWVYEVEAEDANEAYEIVSEEDIDEIAENIIDNGGVINEYEITEITE